MGADFTIRRCRLCVHAIFALALGDFLGFSGASKAHLSNSKWIEAQQRLRAAQGDPHHAYTQFAIKHNRVMSSDTEAAQRKAIFLENVHYSAAENAKGTNKYVLGINKFSDLTFDEFKTLYLMPSVAMRRMKPSRRTAPAVHNKKSSRRPPHRKQLRSPPVHRVPQIPPLAHTAELPWAPQPSLVPTVPLPALATCSVDWRVPSLNPRKLNVITPIKNQGICGSCWAFGAMAALESNILMKGGAVVDLSEQEAINCLPNRSGCSAGGLATDVWAWAQTSGGVASQSELPYLAGNGGYGNNGIGKCVTATPVAGTKPLGWTNVAQMDDNGLAAALMNQPVKVGLFVGPQFQNYHSGVLTCAIGDSQYASVNHELQGVGCSLITDANGVSTPVYIIKNQWGTSWGDGGFAYVKREAPAAFPFGNCGIGSDADFLW